MKEKNQVENKKYNLDYLRIKQIAAKSQATDKDIEKLSDKISSTWWEENKDSFIK